MSHFVRAALDDIVAASTKEVPNSPLSEELKSMVEAGQYPQIAMKLGLRVIHISEIDTQTTSKYVSLFFYYC